MANKTSAKPVYVRPTRGGCFVVTLGNPNNANSILLARCDGLAAVYAWLEDHGFRHNFRLADCKL